MKITLRRFIEVESYAVQMTIFEKEDERPEILPLLKAVKEANLAHTSIVTYLQNKILLDLPETFTSKKAAPQLPFSSYTNVIPV